MGATEFRRGNVCVDENFARFGAKSYAINKITSTEVREHEKRGSRAYIVWWIFAAIILMGAFGAMLGGDAGSNSTAAATGATANGSETGGAITSLIVAAVLGAIGWGSWRRRAQTWTYELLLSTNAGEVQALTTDDREMLWDVRTAIEQAMVK